MSKSRQGFWRALERLAGGAVIAEWKRELGEELERARPFLRPLPALAGSHPCVNAFGCGCPHRVEEIEPGHWEAVCGPDEWCPSFRLEKHDLAVYAADNGVLCGEIARALGLRRAVNGKLNGARVEPVGICGPGGASVYLMTPGDSARMAREVERLFCLNPDPFVLLTPTGVYCSPEVRSALRRQGCLHLGLSEMVTCGPEGKLVATVAVDGLLAGLGARNGGTTSVPATVMSAATDVPIAERQNEFQKNGRLWNVVFTGAGFPLENTLGARYLDYLLHHPNEPISAYDLEIAVQPEKGKARPKDSIQTKLDPETVKQYLRELVRLRGARDKAEDAGDEGEADRLDGDIEALEQELKGGSDSGDAGERARGNVSKAIAAVRRKLAAGGKTEKAFGEHIERFVSTGYQCMYSQEGGCVWS